MTPAANDWKHGAGGLWHFNPRLALLRQQLHAGADDHVSRTSDGWPNATEAEFVERSVSRRRNTIPGVIAFVSAAFVALSLLTQFAFSERNRAEENLRQVETTLASSLLRPVELDDKNEISTGEIGAFWQLATLSSEQERVRLLFLKNALGRPDTARQLRNRVLTAAPAAVGLHPTRRQEVLRNVVMPTLRKHWSSTDPEALEICVAAVEIGIELKATESEFAHEFASLSAVPTIAAIRRTIQDQQLGRLVAVVGTISPHLPTEVRDSVLDSILAGFLQGEHTLLGRQPQQRNALLRCIQAMADRLDAQRSARFANFLLPRVAELHPLEQPVALATSTALSFELEEEVADHALERSVVAITDGSLSDSSIADAVRAIEVLQPKGSQPIAGRAMSYIVAHSSGVSQQQKLARKLRYRKGEIEALVDRAILDNLANVSREEGQLSEARELVSQAVRQFEAAGDIDKFLLCRIDLAWLERLLGDVREARRCLEESVRRSRTLGHRRHLAHAFLTMGAPLQAERDLQQAASIIETVRERLISERERIGFFGSEKPAVFQAVVRVLWSRGRKAEAFAAVERARSRALLDLLERSRAADGVQLGQPVAWPDVVTCLQNDLTN